MKKFKIFLDANIIFSAVKSSDGGSAKLFELAKFGVIKIVTSALALREARRNIIIKLSPTKLPRFYLLLESGITIWNTNKDQAVQKYQEIIHHKDAPILAAAIESKSNFLATFDRKHFMNSKIKKVVSPIQIITPGDFLQKYLF